MTNGWNTKKGAIIGRSSCGGAVHWCACATLLILAPLAFVAPAQARAQTSIELVSTLGQGLSFRSSRVNHLAQTFTTGANASGYTLTSVDVSIGLAQAVPCSFDASVWSANSNGSPNTALAGGGLTTPSITGTGLKQPRFAASGDGIDLNPSEDYTIVLVPSTGNSFTCFGAENTNSNSEAGAAGWSVNNASYFRNPGGSWTHEDQVLKFRVNGYAKSAGNTAPTLDTPIPDQSAVVGTAFSYAFPDTTFSDADTGDTLAYAATKADDAALPTWLSFDADTRTFSGMPASTDTGTVSVKVTASDGDGGSVSDEFDITVVPALTVDFEDAVSLDLVEGNSVDVPVVLSGAPGREVTITLSHSHVSATTASDYTTSSLSLTFGAAETRKVVTVTATDDSEADPGEGLVLSLPAAADLPTGILSGSSVARVIYIADNDFRYQASHAGGTTLAVDEQAGTLTATVRADAPNVTKRELDALNENVVLSVSTADGTATAGQDYTLLLQTLTFAPADFATQRSGCPQPSPNFCTRAEKTVTVPITDDAVYEGATPETFTLTISHQTDQRVNYPSPAGETATVSIADNDGAPTLSIAVDPASIAEAAGTSTLTVSTGTSTFATVQTITLTLGGTATETSDYTLGDSSLMLAAGATSVTTTVTAVQDTIDEPDETVIVTAANGGTAIGSATVTITDDDGAPTLSIAVDPASIAEAAGTSTVTVSTGTAFTTEQTIALTLGGTATQTTDYTLSSASLTLTAGETSVTTTVTAVQDTIDEPDETVIVTAANGGTAIGSATVTITDDDGAPTLSIAVDPASIAEAAGTSTVTVSTGTAFTTDQTIALTLGGTATQTTDYTLSSASLTLTAGETSVTTTVTAVQDTIDEPDETVIVTAANGSTAIGSATVTITDDDDAPTLSIAVDPASIAEAAGTSTVTVSTGTAFTTDQTIALTLGGTATETSDYTLGDSSLTLAAGATSVTTTVTAVQDTVDEPDETVIVTAANGSTAIGSATVTITDDDDAPTLSVAVDPASIAEAAGASTVTVSTGTSTFATVQTIALTLTGTATETSDFTLGDTSLMLAAGATSVTTTVTAVQDTIDEPDETVIVTAANGSTAIGSATVTITDDDDAPTLSIAVDPASIAEAAGASTVTVSTGTSTFATVQTVTLTLGGTATQTTDYTLSSTSLTLTAGEMSVTATVTAVQDTVDEPDETVIVTAGNGGTAIGSATVTITDDDDAPTLSVAVDPASIAEAAGTSTLTVSTGTSTFTTDQTIALTLGGTATETSDFTIGSTSLTLTAGETSVTTTVTAVQDTVDEPDETVIVTAANGSTAIGSATVTITDDDDAPTLSVAVDPASIAEAAGTSTVTVTASGSTFTTDQTIALTLGGTATQTTDYTVSSISLTLTAGETSVTATVTAVQDTIDEPDETVIVNAGNGGTAIGSATVTITDDDDAPTLSIAVDPASIDEAAGTSTVTVSTGATSFATDQTIALTLGGTATQTTDYTLSSTSLTLTAGEMSVTATVTAVQDTVDEPDETVIVNAGNGGTAIGSATVTITDDDDAPTLSVAVDPASIAEAAGTSTVTVTASGSTFTTDQTIALTLGGTATQTTDYTVSSISLTLTAGETSVTATVTAVQDTIDEPDETVIVNAGNGGTAIGSATVTITDDDDAPTLSIAVDPASIDEAAGTSTVTVSTGATSFATDQTIALTLGGTATEISDYTIGSTSLTLTAGATSVTTTVTAVQDTVDEPDETVIVSASNGSTAIGSATVTITDDDAAPTLTFSVSAASIAEAAGTSTVTVSTGTGSTFETAQTITLALDGTAAETDDFTIASTSLTLPAGAGTAASSATTVVTAVQDRIDEADETVLIDANRNSNAVGTRQTVTITDDDDPPVPTFTVSSASIGEAAGTSTVTVGTGTGSTFETAQTITLALDGTAAETDDFTIASTSLTLPAGAGTAASSVTTVVTAVQDRIDEADETVLIDASRNSNAVGTRQTVTVTDDDAPPVLSLEVSASTIDEDGGTSTVTVGTGTGSTFETDQTITLTLGGTATETNDYTIGSKSLTLPAGAGTAASEITTLITAADDDFFEGVTHEQLTLAGTQGGASFGATRSVTITENEDAPKLTLSLTDDSISENGGSTAVTASVSPRTVDAFTVSFAATPTAPATAADYGLTGSLSFAALSATPTGTVTITANNNRVDRPDKSVSVTATSSQSYFRATEAVALTIGDEDAAPAPVLQVGDASISENAGVATVTVTTGDGSTFPDAMTVTLTVTGAAGENADYAILSKSLTLPAGSGLEVSMIGTTVTGIDDIIDDDAEDILIDAAIGVSAVGTRQSIAITDDDDAPVLEISVGPASIAENGGTSAVTVATGAGSTYATDQAITLSLSGTATGTSDYSVDSTLTLPAGVGLAASTVETTLTGVDDIIDDDAETILIDGMRAGAGFGTRRTVTIDDDDAAPVLVFTAQPAGIAENGGVSTLTVGTGAGSTFATEQTVTLAVVEGTAIEGADYTIASRTLTLPAGVGSGAASVATEVTGLDDGVFEGEEDQTVLVSATHGGAPVGTARVAVVDDEANSQVVLALSQASIPESGGNSQITASVSPPAEHAFVVDLEVDPNAPATAADFTTAWPVPSLGLLDFAAGATRSTGLAFIYAVNNEVDTPDKTLTVSGGISGFDYDTLTVEPAATTGIRAPAPLALTIRDDDEAADTLSLSLDAASVAEDAGATDIGVTATLDSAARESAVAVTVTVGGGTGDAGAESGIDFAEVAAFTITIPAGDASASASFPLTPVDDRIDEVGEALSVTGATDDPLIGVPEAAALTITDNDDAPEPTFAVQPATIGENGGTATVTVTTGTGSTYADERTIALSVTGTATAGEDYTISSQALTLPAGVGAGASSVTATVASVDDDIDDDAETIVIGALLDGVALGAAQTVTIDDDEGPPLVTLLLTPPSIAEDGGVGTVTATVSPASATAFTVAVASAPVSPAEAGDFGQSGTTLSFAAGAAASTGSVTIGAVDNTADTPNLQISVSGTVSSPGVSAPADATLTILDDDAAAVLALEVDATTIAEDGGAVTVTVSTGTGSTFDTDQDVTLVLGGSATEGGDYTVSATELTLPAGASSVTATLTALDDDVFEGGETVLISGLHDGAPFGIVRTVTITDDEAALVVTLVLTPASIGEDGGMASVTASVAPAASEAFTVTVSALAVEPGSSSDFTLDGATLSFAADATESTGGVTITAVDNEVDAPDKSVTVSGAVSLEGVTAPAAVTLTIADDDEPAVMPLVVTLLLAPASIGEDGGMASVTASVAPAASEAFTVTVSALAVEPGSSSDFTLDGATLSFAADATESTGGVTITAVDNEVDAPDKSVTVSGAVSLEGVTAPAAVTLTIADDDEPAVMPLVVTLLLTPASIGEDGGMASVTASVAPAASEAFTVTVSALAVEPGSSSDFTLDGATLSFAADATESTGGVTITAVDNEVDAPDKSVTVSGAVSLEGVTAPAAVTLTIADDDEPAVMPLVVTLLLAPASIGEDGGMASVTASVAPAASEAFTVTVSALAVEPGSSSDFTLDGATLSFAADATESTGGVTITAVDNEVDAPDKSVTVSGAVSLEGVTAPAAVTLTIADDDEPAVMPLVVTLLLAPASIGEDGGMASVTASVAPAASEAFTVTVSALAVEPGSSSDFTLDGATLSFAADATESTGGVTITAVDNEVDAPDKSVTVSGAVSLEGVTAPAAVTLTIADDDEPAVMPLVVTLLLAPASIGEDGGMASVTASVAPAASEAFTVTVSALAVEPGSSSDFTLAGATLSFAADATESTGGVTITAVDNEVDAPDKSVTVSGAVSLEGVTAPAAVTLTIADDDEPVVMPPPVERGVEIVPTVLTIGEGDGAGGTYTARLVAEPTADVTVTVSVPSGAGLTVSPTSLTFTADNWGTARTVTVTAGIDDDADDRTVTLAHSAAGGGYGDVTVADVSVTITDLVDPMLPAVGIADARGREAGGQLVFEVTLNGVAGRTVSVEYATIEGTARAGEDYEAVAGTATIAAGETGTRIVVPLLVDVISEPDETFTVTLGGADGARLADTSATGTIEDPAGDGAAPQQWLGRFGRIAGSQVMGIIGNQIASTRDGGPEVSIAGRSLFGDAGAGSADPDRLFGRGGFGAAPPDGLRNATPLSPTSRHWRTQPGARPRGGNGGLGATGSGYGTSGGDAMNLREVLANSAFLLSAGSGGGGFAVWGRGAYTRFDNLGGGLETGGDAVTATLGVDWSCARCVFGVAVSQTRVDATYGAGGGESGDLESTITGLYPYFGARLTERLSVWGLVGQGVGELLSTPVNGATVKVDLESRLAGLGARGDLLVSDSGFTLALKTDALVARTTTDEAEGLLEAEGEYRRLRLGLEGSWLRRFGEDASLRTSLEVAAREDAGDDLEGLGVEVRGGLEFIDVLPGLSLDVEVHGLVSHDAGDSDEYEEWGVSGGFRYDPRPETAAGPLVSLVHSWSPADSVGLGQALWRNDPSRRGPAGASTGRGQENLSAEFAWGFDTFGALSVPWARMGNTGAGGEYRLGYSLLTGRGIPSLEFGESAFGREYALGWEFSLRCRIQVAVLMTHGTGLPGDRSDTGLRIGFRSIMPRRASGGSPGGASCGMAHPLFQSGASSLGSALP